MDQSKLSDRHRVLMLALRHGERDLPLAWRVETTHGAIGFETQRDLLDGVASWVPADTKVSLMADRFYGTADLISSCQERGWSYRLRLKGTLTVKDRSGRSTTAARGRQRSAVLSRGRRTHGATSRGLFNAVCQHDRTRSAVGRVRGFHRRAPPPLGRAADALFGLYWRRAPAHISVCYILQGLDPAAVEAAFRMPSPMSLT